MSVVLKMQQEAEHVESYDTMQATRDMVARAADVASPVWPITSFIACNPLQGFEDMPFEKAVAKAARYQRINKQHSPAREAVNRETIKWLSAYLDMGQATIRMPNRHHGFYKTFADLVRFDGNLKHHPASSWLAMLPDTAEVAIEECLTRLKIAKHDREEFIRQSQAALVGWSGYVKWRDQWQNKTEGQDNPITLADYMAVRLLLTCVLWPDATVYDSEPLTTPNAIDTLPEAETAYREMLLAKLLPEAKTIASTAKSRPQAQLVFCIDVRSEPFRRSLEAQGQYETLGFAGFFGLPVRVKAYDAEEAHDSCPVLLKPCHEVCEHPAGHHEGEVVRHDQGRSLLKLPKTFYQALKYNFATPFALVETLGPWLGIRMLARTFAPALVSEMKKSTIKNIMPEIATKPSLDGITIAQQADFGEGALRMMGLTENIAPLVVFCGHGSNTNNNAYASALDCGACGGNHGGVNARILAAILNKAEIRSIIAARGLAIPEDTVFLAAEHDTTTDHVELYAAQTKHQDALTILSKDLEKARAVNTAARCQTFGLLKESQPVEATVRRSHDWAQPRPEWGLARNAAFIVGPRQITQNVNLEGRCFLHSYDWENDTEGKFLTTILTAPMVVAQWINNQYLFSTLDNVAYGGGSKVTKNITGKIGVMQGNASDLMHGLPMQSVFSTDDTPYHEPLRLLTVVYAPRQVVNALVELNPVLQKLFYNGWVTLTVIDPQDGRSYLLRRDGTWQIAH